MFFIQKSNITQKNNLTYTYIYCLIFTDLVMPNQLSYNNPTYDIRLLKYQQKKTIFPGDTVSGFFIFACSILTSQKNTPGRTGIFEIRFEVLRTFYNFSFV